MGDTGINDIVGESAKDNTKAGSWSPTADIVDTPAFSNSAYQAGEQSGDDRPRFNHHILVSDAMAKNSRQLLYAHIYNYLIQHKYYRTARRLLDEADVPLSKPIPDDKAKSDELLHAKMLMNSKDTFLCEWWESLWTLHYFIETQSVEKISSNRLFHDPVTPILPQRPPMVQSSTTSNPNWTQQQPYQYQQRQQQYQPQQPHFGATDAAAFAPLGPLQPSMAPPRVNDLKANKTTASPSSPLRKSASAYSHVQAAPGGMPTAMGPSGLSVPSHQFGVPNAQGPLGPNPMYSNFSPVVRAYSGASSEQALNTTKNGIETSIKEYQHPGMAPPPMNNAPGIPDNMMIYMQKQHDAMGVRKHPEDDFSKNDTQWNLKQQQLHDQYQKSMYIMMQQQQQQSYQQYPPYPQQRPPPQQQHQQNYPTQRPQRYRSFSNPPIPDEHSAMISNNQSRISNTQQARDAATAELPNRRDIQQLHRQGMGPSQRETQPQHNRPSAQRHVSATQINASGYQNPADLTPDPGSAPLPLGGHTLDSATHMNMMMMHQSPSALSPVIASGQELPQGDKYIESVTNMMNFGNPLQPSSSHQN
ncbi:LAME_0E04962g1_1 [Lachancea meyersii CBS 8951]|uniref:LAME_0E04962g1_1 n=1 Tax=Lachancea meyersii CBS 8951 TaxID=1266667 RepID=A0A1G4JH41_9SACH|nr:LAME_0E04962g1_1 [Lachancea meyersii CBS 8951]